MVFVLHINRVRGGCFNGLSVHPWQSFHVDELRQGSEMSKVPLDKLKGTSLAEVLEQGLLPVDQMIAQALPQAASKTRFKGDEDRIIARLHYLVMLTSPEEEARNADLVKCMREKVVQGVRIDSEKLSAPKGWLVRHAKQSVFLKEGNTFQKAIWLHIVDVIKPHLSDTIAFMDIDNCLDLLLPEAEAWQTDAAIFILDKTKVTVRDL